MESGTGVCTASHCDRRVLDHLLARGSHRALVKHWALVSRPNRLREKDGGMKIRQKILNSSWAREEGPGSDFGGSQAHGAPILQGCLISDAHRFPQPPEQPSF